MKHKLRKKLASAFAFFAAALVALAVATPAYAATAGTLIAHDKNDAQWGGDYTLTIRDTTGASSIYRLLQVFTGDYASGDLSNIKWGASIKNDAATGAYDYSGTFIAALKTAFPDDSSIQKLTTNSTAEQVATAIRDWGEDSTKAQKLANVILDLTANSSTTSFEYKQTSSGLKVAGTGNAWDYTFADLNGGYYLVYETANSASEAVNKSYTRSLVKVVGTQTVDLKADPVTVSKQVVDVSGTDPNYTVSSGANAKSVAIGDTLNFQVTSKVPNMNGYSSYTFIVDDIMSQGLTFSGITQIKIGDTVLTSDQYEIAYYKVDSTSYTNAVTNLLTGSSNVKTDDTSTTDVNEQVTGPVRVQITLKGTTGGTGNFIDWKSQVGETISVLYTAKVNTDAISGNTDELWNQADVRYSRDRDYPDDEGKLGRVTDGTSSKVKLYTGGFYLKKTDSRGNRLSGAKWTITGEALNQIVNDYDTYEAVRYDSTNWKNVYYLNKGGTAYMVADETTGDPNGGEGGTVSSSSNYSRDLKATPIEYTYDGTNYTRVAHGAGTYYKTTSGDYVSITSGLDTSSGYLMEYATYTKTEHHDIVTVGTTKVSKELEMGSSGLMEIKGLAAGTYYITETTAPAGGYQLRQDKIKLVIGWDTSVATDPKLTYTFYPTETATESLTSASNTKLKGIMWEETTNDGTEIPTLRVDNDTHTGTLPTTGGIGTTVFYVVGGVMVVAATVLLVTKRRMSANRA